MSSAIFDQFADQIKAYVIEVINNFIAEGRINLDRTAGSFATFSQQYLSKYSGSDKVEHATLRELCQWLDVAINEFQETSVDDVKAEIKYIIASGTAGTGILVSPVQNLLVSGAGVEPTVPSPTSATPNDLTFDLTSDLLPGQIGFNITDLKMYVRLGNTIYDVSSFITFPDNYRADEATLSAGSNTVAFSSALVSDQYILTVNDVDGVGIEVSAQTASGFTVDALGAGNITYHAILKK